ncbi:wall-associated receptor kinase 3-like [Cryptomeria japonica]|uniref:wall-associated receptor kinase 3-like n=1 Tax=Cryptomeria japonica TaxID=3369 RepID=UPI0027D9D79D|nr:wall-associated receptor kinase 3-like [Cryptomeria japonica]
MGFTAAKCVLEKCGPKNVSYPFWIHNSHCGHPGFQINCTKDEDTGMLSPFFTAFGANSTGSFADILVREATLTYNQVGLSLFPSPFGTCSIGDLGEARCVTMNLQSDQPCCRYGCCEINLPDNLPFVNFTGGGSFPLPNQNERRGSACGFSTIMEPSTFTIVDNKTYLFSVDVNGSLPYYGLRLNSGIGLENCSTAKATVNYSCSSNAECLDSPSGKGYVCKCHPGYEGNGYSNGTGCTGYVGDGFANGTRCKSTSSNRLIFDASIGSVSSLVVVSLAATLLVCWLKKRHLKLVEAKYSQLLQQYIASTLGRESLRIFSSKELARASSYYSNEMLLGSGGFGTVFKGNLLDGTLVAIKKSKQALNVKEDHEFLNEVTILSQINHRNIVKVFGCCIQTEFPMLVSEFVPNGTLFDHLHSEEKYLPWASRLQIAIETGEALAYLHSGAFQPIFHRDIKSSNILLNEGLSPKVADFGISHLISTSNNTHVTTNNIKGTWGYLDPEYFETFQLTEKSDVYSFGVVLLELLTALKPISVERDSSVMSLSSLFLSRFNNNRLTEILDNKLLEEENLQEMEDMARIARECLHL